MKGAKKVLYRADATNYFTLLFSKNYCNAKYSVVYDLNLVPGPQPWPFLFLTLYLVVDLKLQLVFPLSGASKTVTLKERVKANQRIAHFFQYNN